ncbi:MAG: bifunctional [glutamate--ammonia ligase]-adenylyl-L-tyrosine phosphorylase/[glutamate--ammonia-ligase] adenylyltransferase [Xanthomonadaceae bacterium]|jgi:glutamate-ammonia-ligase adenylyltransferase|nr:bifunctional [glutamate--ammonia ligase]-adenylyl-L-tyrosine phosphorylase/[glutamate--ammonia-ligase] adenylyltransferase [Xanthomonadaceae bacterium]
MLRDIGERAVNALRQTGPQYAQQLDDTDLLAVVKRVAIVSDFAIDVLRRQPELLLRFAGGDLTPLPLPVLAPESAAEWPTRIRRYRTAESTRLIWRDVTGIDSVDATLSECTRLAENCLAVALTALEGEFAARYGVVRAEDGAPQRLVVFGLGKLGGGELNFSSDVDLVYAYPRDGESDGPRSMAAEDYFARLGQRLARLLDDVTAEGFSHRVDLRLRPFGNAGRIAWSFLAMDQYFQREGRDWERYAWLKARAVAGDIEAGEGWLQTLRPFVYRRYLDFTALDGLRSMKASIAVEVARRDLSDDIKRGPGGIREIEFLAQSLQLIRGGREPALRERRLLPALLALTESGQIEPETTEALIEDYRFLRLVENRLQMLRDAQTQMLPAETLDRERIAQGLDYPDWEAFHQILEMRREHVSTEFDALLVVRQHVAAPDALTGYWSGLPEGGDMAVLAEAGFADTDTADGSLRDFARSAGVAALSDNARARLNRVLPALLASAARSSQPDAALKRLLALLQAILRRTSYLALLDEQPSALRRLVDVLARSAMLGEQLVAYPVLLDELLDARVSGPIPDGARMLADCRMASEADDPEAALRALNEIRLALSFRIGMATLDRRQPVSSSARQLASLADAVVEVVLDMAEVEVAAAHGRIPGGRFAVIGYGSLGGQELGFGSDLDLVFLYDADVSLMSDGKRPLEASRWYARLAQKVVALLGTVTGAGRLYDTDVRLRPDGAQGLLVSSLASYGDYQRQRAWTWEHQALVRARSVAGDASLLADFEAIRWQTLTQHRDESKLREDVSHMRQRMRAELDRSDAARFDLKQGAGGLVDLEFLLQYGVLNHAPSQTALLEARNTPGMIASLRDSGWLGGEDAQSLSLAHATLLEAGLVCALDRRPRLTRETAGIATARQAILHLVSKFGLNFAVEGTDGC